MRARVVVRSLLVAGLIASACRTYTVTYTDDGGTCNTNTHLVCNDVCVDPATDRDNCGGCGQPCGDGELCSGGACVMCPTGLTLVCGGGAPFCTDPLHDNDNCGGCGVACAQGTSCQSGKCGCPLTMCGADCVDVTSDIAHCGACDTPCPSAPPNEVPLCSASHCSATCVTPFADCDGLGSNGCESNLQTGSASCGACNRACVSGGTCTAGMCPITEYATDKVMGLAVDSSSVYWENVTLGQVDEAPLGGGSAQLVFGVRAGHLAVDSTTLYWDDTVTSDAGVTNEVVAYPLGSGSTIVLATITSNADLALYGSYVYFITPSARVSRVPTDGSAMATTLTNSQSATKLAVDGTNVYFVSSSGSIFHVAVSSISATPTSFAGVGNAGAIAVDTNNVYWTTNIGQIDVQAKGSMTALALASGQAGLTVIATDGVAVYWAATDAIRKVAVTGGVIETLATGQTAPITALVLDATRVYWTAADAVRSTTK